MSAPLIELAGVRKTYTRGELRVEVLRGVDLRIEAGEFVAILGASGSGKSTLLNLLGALARPSAGQYRLAGEDVGALSADALARLRRRYFGFVFQQYHLLGGLSAQENVELPAIYAGLDGADRRARARGLLQRLGLGDRLDHRPGQLSGGQQQRVSLARALMNDARIILADEPTGALDQATGREVLGLLEALNAEGRTIILVTHDPAVAARAPRRIEMVDGLVQSAGPAPPRRAVPPAPPVRDAGFAAAAGQAVRMALRTLHGNLLRTLLTLLGVVIGVAAVVAVVAFGAGARDSVIEQISAMGTDLLNVRPGAPNLRRAGNSVTTLVPADAQALAELDGVVAAVPEASGAVTVRYGGVDHQTSLTATTAQFNAVRDWPVQSGAFFTDDDTRRYAPVAVIGQTTARNLFGEADPVGRFVLAGNVPLEVIGVLSAKGATPFGGDQDDTLVVPLTTGQLRLLGVQHLQGVTVRVGDRARMDAVQAQVEALLLARHSVVDFQVRSMAALLDTVTATQNTLTVLLGTVAAISLLVGGIGVMNIMLVSVSERTAEIGLRMATGARRMDILLQFAIEAVVVCAAGGLVGVAVGALAAAGADALGVPIAPAPMAGLLAAGAALLTGLVFGQLPARRAAALDPVQALARE